VIELPPHKRRIYPVAESKGFVMLC